MYENYKLCPELRPSEVCIVLEQYHEGKFERQFHEHVPRSRLSEDARINLLRALVIRFYGWAGMGPEGVVRSFLNRRGNKPVARDLRFHTTYPEPGVIRYCCGADTQAWIDVVIAPRNFRQPAGDKPSQE
jgi:hypothetical protein